MSVYVGIDVHRKRSQVAVIDAGGEVLANRNVPNGVEPILKVIGGLPPGTPAAFEAAYGTSWLVELLEGYGFDPHLVHPSRCKAIASARLKNDKVDAAILGQLLRADLLPEAWIAPPPVRALRALLRHRVALVRLRTRLRNRIHAIVADYGYDRPAGGYWSGPGRAWLASLQLPAVFRELVEDYLGLIGAVQERIDRLDWEIRQRARSGPAGQGAHPAAGHRPVHRAGHPRRGRRHQPVRLGAPAGFVGRAHPHRPRQRPGRPLRAHLQTGLGVAALGAVRGGANRQALPRVRARLPAHRQPAGEEDRHHRHRPQAGCPRLAPARRRRARRSPATPHAPNSGAVTPPEGVAWPRASSKNNLSRAPARARRSD
jgi:transposase